MEEKLISVVIPVYNSSEYISECLDATIGQTYSNIEIIIVDDGSTDNTLEICKKYENADTRVQVLTHSNKGVSYTRNEGICKATGDYIVFFDADDYPEANLIEKYVSTIEECWQDKDLSFVVCGMFFDNYLNKHVSDKSRVLEVSRGYIEGENYVLSRSSAAMLSWLKLFNFVTNKFYNLKVIKDNQILFDTNVHVGEDLKFNLDYLDNCSGNIGMVNLPLYHYVKRRDDSLSISYHLDDLEDTKCIYKRFINWESSQELVTDDNIMVVKAIFLNDWMSRLTALREEYKGTEEYAMARHKLSKEIRSREFQRLLKEVFKAQKISLLRYLCLRTGILDFFYFFRGIYQVLKG